jgi:hypothetical protein
MELRAPLKVTTAEQAIEYAIDTYEVVEKVDPSRVQYLRISSFPFCGVQWLLGYPIAVSGRRTNKFMGSYFTSVGTSVHSSIQATLDHSPFIIQDWFCPACKHLHAFKLRPAKCKGCGAPGEKLKGKEHTYKKDVILGHLDGAILLKGGKIVIIDYKTTSVRKAGSKTAIPGLSNVRQIEAYAALLKQEGYDISGWTLIYISRDNAKRIYKSSDEFYGHSFDKEYPKVLKRVSKYVSDYKVVTGAKTLKDIETIVANRRLLSTEPGGEELCGYCPYKAACINNKMLSAKLEKSLGILNKEK